MLLALHPPLCSLRASVSCDPLALLHTRTFRMQWARHRGKARRRMPVSCPALAWKCISAQLTHTKDSFTVVYFVHEVFGLLCDECLRDFTSGTNTDIYFNMIAALKQIRIKTIKCSSPFKSHQ